MVKNENLAYQVLDLIETIQEAILELYDQVVSNNSEIYSPIILDLNTAFLQILSLAPDLKPLEEDASLPKTIKSCLASLGRIRSYLITDRKKALDKLEYELLPMTQSAKTLFYYQSFVYPDKDKIRNFHKEQIAGLTKNPYIEESEKTGNYKYELSIIVLAYNKLEYTKLCVESLLKFLPATISYELILANNGSTDGTKEYFESINPNKQYDTEVNYGGIGGIYRIIEGEFLLCVSNDVVMTAYALENMIRCMREDKEIGLIVPSTPNITNMQSIPMEYKNLEEMHVLARKNNAYDPSRHEQRVRLCDPVSLYRSSFMNQYALAENTYTGLYSMTFPDDRTSLLLRRNGYKLILAKDAYCFHFGSITIKDELQKKGREATSVYENGCREFEAFYGINPWGTGFCYDLNLAEKLSEKLKPDSRAVLGINCGLGANALKAKEMLKEKYGNFNCTLYNYTNEHKYFEDLKGISDHVDIYQTWQELLDKINALKFDCIIWEDGLADLPAAEKIIGRLCLHLEKGGVFIFSVLKTKKLNTISKCKVITTINHAVRTDYKWILLQYNGSRER